MSKMSFIFFLLPPLARFLSLSAGIVAFPSPDGQPRSLAGPVCEREPLCLLEPSPPFSILVWQSLFYFSPDQVSFFRIFMLPLYLVAFYYFTFKQWPPFSPP